MATVGVKWLLTDYSAGEKLTVTSTSERCACYRQDLRAWSDKRTKPSINKTTTSRDVVWRTYIRRVRRTRRRASERGQGCWVLEITSWSSVSVSC